MTTILINTREEADNVLAAIEKYMPKVRWYDGEDEGEMPTHFSPELVSIFKFYPIAILLDDDNKLTWDYCKPQYKAIPAHEFLKGLEKPDYNLPGHNDTMAALGALADMVKPTRTATREKQLTDNGYRLEGRNWVYRDSTGYGSTWISDDAVRDFSDQQFYERTGFKWEKLIQPTQPQFTPGQEYEGKRPGRDWDGDTGKVMQLLDNGQFLLLNDGRYFIADEIRPIPEPEVKQVPEWQKKLSKLLDAYRHEWNLDNELAIYDFVAALIQRPVVTYEEKKNKADELRRRATTNFQDIIDGINWALSLQANREGENK